MIIVTSLTIKIVAIFLDMSRLNPLPLVKSGITDVTGS